MSKPQSNYLFQWFDPDNNDFLVGGKVYTYICGTTTDKATYTEHTLTTPNSNPITLDSYGSAIIYLNGPTKFVVKDADGVTVDTQDYVGSPTESWYDATYYGAAGTQAAITAAIAAMGSNDGTLYLKSGTWSITSNLTTAKNINIKMEVGAKLSMASGKTFTPYGPIEFSPTSQIFAWTGTGAIDLTYCPTKDFYLENWGGVATTTANVIAGTLTDNSAIYAKAHDSNLKGKTLWINQGFFAITSNVQFTKTDGFTLEGTDPERSVIWINTGATVNGLVIGVSGTSDVPGTDANVYNYSAKNFQIAGPANACKNGFMICRNAFGEVENVNVILGAAEYAYVRSGCEHQEDKVYIGTNSGYYASLGITCGKAANGMRICRDGYGWSTNTFNKVEVHKSGSFTAAGGYGVRMEYVGANFSLSGNIEDCPGAPGYGLYATDCGSCNIHNLYLEGNQNAILLERCLRMTLDNVNAPTPTQVIVSESWYDTWKAAGGTWLIDTGLWSTSYVGPDVTTLKSCSGTVIRNSNLGVLRIEPSCSNTTVESLSLNEPYGLQDYGSDTQYIGGPYLSYSYKPMKTSAIYGENRENLFTNSLFNRWNASSADGWVIASLTMQKSGTGGGGGLTLNHSSDYCAKFVTTAATGELTYTFSAEQIRLIKGTRINTAFWGNFPIGQTWTTRAGLFYINITVPDWTGPTIFKVGDAVNVTAAFLVANPAYAGARQWVCTTSGTTAASEPTWSNTSHQESSTTDGTVVWTAVVLSVNSVPGQEMLTAFSDGLWRKYSLSSFIPWNITAVSFSMYLYRQPASAETTFYLAEPTLHIGATPSRGVQPGQNEFPSSIQIGANRIHFAAAVPDTASTWYQAGDLCINTSTALPSQLGWRCITSGVAGASVWRAIPNVVYGSLTLANAGETTTTTANTAVLATSAIILTATSAAAAAAVGTAAGVYVSTKTPDTSFVVTHPANPGASATMDYVIIN